VIGGWWPEVVLPEADGELRARQSAALLEDLRNRVALDRWQISNGRVRLSNAGYIRGHVHEIESNIHDVFFASMHHDESGMVL
jgi:hypothetical protein